MRNVMWRLPLRVFVVSLCAAIVCRPGVAVGETVVDLSELSDSSAVEVRHQDQRLYLQWPAGDSQDGHLILDLSAGAALIHTLGLSRGQEPVVALLRDVDPVTFITVGSRQGRASRGWTVFFDKVHQRPYRTYRAQINLHGVRVSSRGRRATIVVDALSAGPFRGQLCFTVYEQSPLVHVEAVVRTQEDGLAILYDAGLTSTSSAWQRSSWMATDGKMQSEMPDRPARHVRVRHRTMIAENDGGSVALMPPPHQFFYPLDFSTNLGFTWFGRGFHDSADRIGIGIRQHPEGDRRFVPWFNAPPGTDQRLGIFYLLSRGKAKDALSEVLRYTNNDRFVALPGHVTFTSHYHFAHTMQVMQQRAQGNDLRSDPQFVALMKKMGVKIVHMAEFHGDGNPRDPGPQRLPQLQLMHQECERLSNEDFLLLPGEEPNVHFGGHWMILFPRPVYWIMRREKDQPMIQKDNYYGTVYRVGNADELHRMLRREGGLAWTAHARIKGSYGYPDEHRQSAFYLSDRWLGAAWKAMPADLSRPKLGERILDLLSDMDNWGQKKYALGEVDVFKIDTTHELYGHMNINYLRLDDIPRFQDGWQPVLDALSAGAFFVSTGEVLLPEFTVDGMSSGQTVQLAKDGRVELVADVRWTFPLSFAEVVSGDGENVFRQRIDLADTMAFGQRKLRLHPQLKDRQWVRLEVWDIAANGAFTQPVWLDD